MLYEVITNISMYHFENDYASEVVDSYFGWETSKIEQQGSLGYKFYDGGNFRITSYNVCYTKLLRNSS